MLVIIALGDMPPGKCLSGRNSENLCQNSDFDTPVGGNPCSSR